MLDASPAHAVRGPKHVIKRGKTPVLTREETRDLLDSIETDDIAGLRDRALIGLLVFSFARIGAGRVCDKFVGDLPSGSGGGSPKVLPAVAQKTTA